MNVTMDEISETKFTEKIFNHAVKIIALLTGKASLLEQLTDSLKMTEISSDKKVTEKILTHAMEIICLLTGELEDVAVSSSKEGHNEVKEEKEEIPANKSSDMKDNKENPVSEEEEEDEIDESDIVQVTVHPDLFADLPDENLERGSSSEEEDERGRPGSIQGVSINSKTRSGQSKVKSENVFKQDDVLVKGHQQVKEEPFPISISNDDSMNTAENHVVSIKSNKVVSGQETNQTKIITLCNKSVKIMVETLKPHVEAGLLKPCLSAHRKTKETNYSVTPLNTPNKGVTKSLKIHNKKPNLSCKPHLTPQNVQKEQKPFPCTECEKSFAKKSCLVRHQRSHSGEKAFPCPDCGKCCLTKSYLAIHQRVHTGERPYPCAVCGKGFRQKTALVRHQVIHTGEKPYECSNCGKRFNDKTSLIRHEKIHSGDDMFACSECGKLFVQYSNLVRHEKIHKKEKYSRSMIIRRLWEGEGVSE